MKKKYRVEGFGWEEEVEIDDGVVLPEIEAATRVVEHIAQNAGGVSEMGLFLFVAAEGEEKVLVPTEQVLANAGRFKDATLIKNAADKLSKQVLPEIRKLTNFLDQKNIDIEVIADELYFFHDGEMVLQSTEDPKEDLQQLKNVLRV